MARAEDEIATLANAITGSVTLSGGSYRCSKIKLAGFKSFVDPTSVLLPGQLVGVVGPNGCGKSNIMDAVRWVLGESKASELRGESMQDVIFNGTTTRKPARQPWLAAMHRSSLTSEPCSTCSPGAPPTRPRTLLH